MEIKDQRSRSFIKIIGIELDHQKYQDHLGDLGSCRSKIMIFTQLWPVQANNSSVACFPSISCGAFLAGWHQPGRGATKFHTPNKP